MELMAVIKQMGSDVYDVLIVGGGTGGISVAARLGKYRRLFPRVAVLEPSETHDYQLL